MTESVRDLTTAWEHMSSQYLPGRQRVIAALIEEIRQLPGPITVIDVGCGPGTLLSALAQGVEAFEGIGIDDDPVLLAIAQMHLAPLGEQVRLVDTALDNGWSLDSRLVGGADVIVAMLVLHYFPAERWPTLLREFHDLLRPGGRLAILDVTHDRFLRASPSAVEARELERDPIDWDRWWSLAASSGLPGLKDRFREREGRPTRPSAEYHPEIDNLEQLVGDAGFAALDVRLRFATSYLAIVTR